jgi:hypothetical protein
MKVYKIKELTREGYFNVQFCLKDEGRTFRKKYIKIYQTIRYQIQDDNIYYYHKRKYQPKFYRISPNMR